MTKKASGNDLLIPWILMCLDQELFKGLQWVNKEKKIFRLEWTHRSAERWNSRALEVFKAWAKHKGNNYEKEKDLKSTFRCALNSKKKELKLIKKDRCFRDWQILEPTPAEQKEGSSKVPKRAGRRRRSCSKTATATATSPEPQLCSFPDTTTTEQEPAFPPETTTPSISGNMVQNSELPSFESSFPFWPSSPLTPLQQLSDCMNKPSESSWNNNGYVIDTNRWSPPADQSFYSTQICGTTSTVPEVPHETSSYTMFEQSPARVPSSPATTETEFDDMFLLSLLGSTMTSDGSLDDMKNGSPYLGPTESTIFQNTTICQNSVQNKFEQSSYEYNPFLESQLTPLLGTGDMFDMEYSYLQQIVPSM